jgi:mannose-6-phosphate isomerase-like protein (cupin superfamily)
MKTIDSLKRATVYTAVDIVGYEAGKLETARIMSKTTGSVTLMAVDAGVDIGNKISPFDTLVYILEGIADVTIDNAIHHLVSGQCIVVPAHFGSHLVSERPFKMLVTIIKSGYEG